MKTKIIKSFFLFILTTILHSCSFGEHYHDGKYQTEVMFVKINYEINGNEITMYNSLTGVSKLKCKQYPDRIEYTEDNGTTRILTALENGDLKFSDMLILHKINESQNNETIDEKEKSSEKELSSQNSNPIKETNNNSKQMISNDDFKNGVEKKYRKIRNKILQQGVAIDNEDSFETDLNNDGNNEIIKYYTLAPKEGGCMYVGRGIIVYENTKNGLTESKYEPDYAFEFTGVENGIITVSKLDFSEEDMCYPSIPTKGILNYMDGRLLFD